MSTMPALICACVCAPVTHAQGTAIPVANPASSAAAGNNNNGSGAASQAVVDDDEDIFGESGKDYKPAIPERKKKPEADQGGGGTRWTWKIMTRLLLHPHRPLRHRQVR